MGGERALCCLGSSPGLCPSAELVFVQVWVTLGALKVSKMLLKKCGLSPASHTHDSTSLLQARGAGSVSPKTICALASVSAEAS